MLFRLGSGWQQALAIVQPATVLRWHREGFRRFWARKSRRRDGRPALDREMRALIRKMSIANVTWGAPRRCNELANSGIKVCRSMRDRDRLYGKYSQRRVRNLGIEEVLTAARSPWQNPLVERLLGSIRRDCLDPVIVLNESHLRRVLRSYVQYYHRSRCHLSLDGDAPESRTVRGPEMGGVVELPEAGGLHHRYLRVAP